MNSDSKIDLRPSTIDELLGSVGADEENSDRLRAFFFKSAAYDQLKSKYPFHIVVGRKGTGKTAMIRYVGFEEEASGRLVLNIDFARSDLVSSIPADYNAVIRFWKKEFETALCTVFFDRMMREFPFIEVKKSEEWRNLSLNVVRALTLNPITKSKVTTIEDEKALTRFLSAAKTNTITVNIDNLDRAWRIDKKSMTAMAAMMDGFREIVAENRGIRINVALRTDMFYQLLPAQESTDKLASARVFLDWTNQEILAMLVKRVLTYMKVNTYTDVALMNSQQSKLVELLSPLIVETFEGSGEWEDEPMNHVMLSLVRRRPRDMVNLLRDAATCAYKKHHVRIESEDIRDVMPQYSQGCLVEICTEYGNEIANLKELLMMIPRNRKERALLKKDKSVFSTSEINARLKKIRGEAKLFFKGSFAPVTADDLRCFLYRIGFLTAREMKGGKPDWTFYEDEWILGDVRVDKGKDWEIHPAYRFAIGDEESLRVVNRLRAK